MSSRCTISSGRMTKEMFALGRDNPRIRGKSTPKNLCGSRLNQREKERKSECVCFSDIKMAVGFI